MKTLIYSLFPRSIPEKPLDFGFSNMAYTPVNTAIAMNRQYESRFNTRGAEQADAFLKAHDEAKRASMAPQKAGLLERQKAARAAFDALPLEIRRPINKQFRQARLAGKATLFHEYLLAKMIELGLVPNQN
jgi:hypothetical protein